MKSKPLFCLSALATLIFFGFRFALAQDSESKPVPSDGPDRDPFLKTGNPVGGVVDEGAPDANPGVSEIVVLLEYIQTDLVAANRLLEEFGALVDATPLRERLEVMLDDGEAELIETCFLRTASGSVGKSVSCREHIYGTDFVEPQFPNKVDGLLDQMPVTSSLPTEFVTRMVGTSVQWQPVISPPRSDGKREVNITIAPEIIRYLGDRRLNEDGSPRHRAEVYPDFSVMDLDTTIKLVEGSVCLLGLHRPMAGELKGKRVFVLLRADQLKPVNLDRPIPLSDNSRKVVTHLEYIQLDHKDANRLLVDNWRQRDVTELRKTLDKMIADTTATLIESCFIKSLPSQRAKLTSTIEHTYCTEFEPPNLPIFVKGSQKISPVGALPDELVTRDVGITVEVEATLKTDQEIISVAIAPEIVEFLGNRKIAEVVPDDLQSVFHPDFYSMSLTTDFFSFPGHHNLIGTFTPSGDPTKRILLFAKFEVLR